MAKQTTGSFRQKFDQIKFLIRRKFPTYHASQVMKQNPNATFVSKGAADLDKTVEKYRTDLNNKTNEQISKLYSQEKSAQSAEQEQQQFFNQPEAEADFTFWSKSPYWTLDEATALSFGKDPKVVNWDRLKSLVPTSPFAKEFAKVHDLTLRVAAAGDLSDPVIPGDFLAWAKKHDIPIPPDLVAQVAKYVPNVDDRQNSHPLAAFREMESLRFKEITIKVDPENLVLRISAREKQATDSFKVIGLLGKNDVSLNQQGKTFMTMANKEYSPAQPPIKAVSNLSKLLRDAFDTKDVPFVRGVPQFHVSIPKDKEAQRRAEQKTDSYDDTRGAHSVGAQAFSAEIDPSFDPENQTCWDEP